MVFDPANIETTRFVREGQSPADYGSFPLPTDHKPLRVPGSPGQFQINAKSSDDARQAALLFASYVVKPETAATVAQTYGYPSAVKGVLPPENLPIQRAWAEWIQKDVSFHKLTDQGLPQDVVAAYFEAQDSLILGSITPKEAGEQVQEAVTRFKKRSN
jgi:raffinose/stachyose/melibiose transport system substrate-binding protein